MANHQPISDKNVALKHFSRHCSSCGKNSGDSCNYPKSLLPFEGTGIAPLKFRLPGSGFENHHLVACTPLKKFEIWESYANHRDIIKRVYMFTKWCSSRNENLIRLPKNDAVRAQTNLPRHNHDHWSHGGYNDQVTSMLHNRIWLKCKEAKDLPICEDSKEVKDAYKALRGMGKETEEPTC